MQATEDEKLKRLGYGCLAAIAVPILVLLAYLSISDYLLRQRIQRQRQEHEAFDLRYLLELNRLDQIFGQVLRKCSTEEKEKLTLAQDYFHTVEESCRGWRGNDRQSRFDELETGIQEMTALLKVLESNPGLSPFKAREKFKDFHCF